MSAASESSRLEISRGHPGTSRARDDREEADLAAIRQPTQAVPEFMGARPDQLVRAERSLLLAQHGHLRVQFVGVGVRECGDGLGEPVELAG